MSIYFENTYQRSFGTYPLTGADLAAAMKTAVEVGYRAFDTAQMYGNEADVGTCIPLTRVPREELLITTKVHPDNYQEERFIPSVEQSLSDLKLEFADVLLLHWPPADGDIVPPLRLLQQARDRGLARHIGVSNFNSQMMRKAVQTIEGPIVTNQVEFHPLLNQDTLLAASAETGVPLSSYCSVARGEIFKHAIFAEIGEAYGRTAGQIALHWILQKGVSINTMSTKPANIRANFEVLDFTLSSVDMARIDAMTATGFRIVTADVSPWAPAWD